MNVLQCLIVIQKLIHRYVPILTIQYIVHTFQTIVSFIYSLLVSALQF